jgi:ribonuclease P protein component
MLPVAHRLRSASDFTAATRRGRRASGPGLVLYFLAAGPDQLSGKQLSDQTADERPAKVGLIVGRSVGGSVVRHRVSRRLRAQLACRVDRLPAGSRLVVRALPAAAAARSDELGRTLDSAVGRLTSGVRR